MTTQYNYCCQEIDNPDNKWIDCNKCEDMKPFCTLITDQNDCDNGIYKKYCHWNNNKCVFKQKSPPFAQSVTPCEQSFSSNYFCMPETSIQTLSGNLPNSPPIIAPHLTTKAPPIPNDTDTNNHNATELLNSHSNNYQNVISKIIPSVPNINPQNSSQLYISTAPHLAEYFRKWYLPIIIILFILVIYLLLRPPKINSTTIL